MAYQNPCISMLLEDLEALALKVCLQSMHLNFPIVCIFFEVLKEEAYNFRCTKESSLLGMIHAYMDGFLWLC